MKGFGLEIVAYDPFLPVDIFEKSGAGKVDTLDELFKVSDIISVQTPHTPKTHHMIGKKQFELAKENLILVDCGRGGVIDEDALKTAIEEKRIFGAGIDVLEDEDKFDTVLFDLNEVVVTPHTAYYSIDAEMDIHKINMTDILTVLEKHELPANLLNKDVDGKARFQK